jgi:hypothetical protein
MSKKKPRPLAILEGNTSPKYWEQILAKEGLSMDAGRRRFRDAAGRERNRLAHVGDSNNLEDIHEMIVGQNGKVKPPGAGPDTEGNGEGRS